MERKPESSHDNSHHSPIVDPDPKVAAIEENVEALTVAASLNGKALRELFRNRNFVPLLFGQLVSYIGDQFATIASLTVIGQLAKENSGLAIALLGMSLAVPQILFGLIAGVLVDQWNRKVTMIVSDVVRGLAMFSLLIIHGDSSRVWIFFPAMFVIGTAQTLFYPARASALPAIVQKRYLAGANALLEAGFVIALILGAGGAGILIQQFGGDFAFAFNGLAYAFSALMIFLIRIPLSRVVAATEHTGGFREVWADLRDGLSYIWRTKSMRYIMGLSVMVAAGLGSIIVLVLDYLQKTLKIPPTGFGVVIGILGVGIVIGGIVIQRLSKYLPTNRLVALAMLLDGLAVTAFIFHPPFAIVLVATALIGFSVIIARGVLSTLTQAIPPEEYRGRVQGAFNLIFSAPLALAIGLAGLLVSLFSQEAVFAGFGLTLVFTAWLAVNMLRGIDDAIYSDDAI
jgi:MFS family permease